MLFNEIEATLIQYPAGKAENYTIPSSVTTIGLQAFQDCTGLTSVTIPSSVTSIGYYAFQRCSALTSVTIPSSVTSIGDDAFFHCTGLTTVTLEQGVTTIGPGMFGLCSGLTSVTIPSSVTSIGRAAFGGCIGLASVTIPSSVTSIGIGAFKGCTGLTSVTIPSSVTSIGGDAFSLCSGLTSAFFHGNAPEIEQEPWVGDVFEQHGPGFTIFYLGGSTGFTSPTWRGYPTQEVIQAPTTLVAIDGPVGYFIPSDDSLGLTWTQPSFDGSSWTQAPTGVGWETAGGTLEPIIETNISDQLRNVNAGAYFRWEFNFDNADGFNSLTLNVNSDDGFVAYINGVEVAALNTPTPIAWNSQAIGSTSDENVVKGLQIDIAANALRNGANVLGIHAMNSSVGGEDFVIRAGLDVYESVLDGGMSVRDVATTESGSFVEIPVTLNGTTAGAATAIYSTVSGNAQADIDFTATTGTVTIPAGQQTATITVPIINDSIDELDETFTLQLSNPVNATLVVATATVTIEDDDVSFLSISDASAQESAGTITFPVSLSNPSSRAVTVNYATAGGSATEGTDYTMKTGTLMIPAGATSTNLAVQLVDDGLAEGDEQFTVTLSSASTAVGDGSATITILDDDVAELSITDVVIDEWADTATVVVSLSARNAALVGFNYRTESGSATSNLDFRPHSGFIEIASGEWGTSISIPILDDTLVEGTEQFTFVLENVTGAEVGKGTAVVTINDGGPGYDGWALEQGVTERAGLSDDASGDGFPNSFHYAMRIPAAAFVQSDYPDLVPIIDNSFFENKATLFFQIPDNFRDDVILKVEESVGLETWRVIASKDGKADWFFQFPNLVISESPKNGYRGVGVTASGNYTAQGNGFYRLRVRAPVMSIVTPEGNVISQEPITSAADLDLEGDFLYAINVGGPAQTVGEVQFVSDQEEISGVSWMAQHSFEEWLTKTDLGAGADNEALATVLWSIRWSRVAEEPGGVSYELSNLDPDKRYKLQLLFAEKCCERGFDVTVNGETIVQSFSPDIVQSQAGGRASAGAALVYTFSSDSATLTIDLDGMNADFPDRNAMLSGITLEQIANAP